MIIDINSCELSAVLIFRCFKCLLHVLRARPFIHVQVKLRLMYKQRKSRTEQGSEVTFRSGMC